MTKQEATRIVGTLKAAFPRQQIEPETLGVYARKLIRYKPDVALAGIDRLLEQTRFFPTIAEILTAIEETSIGRIPNAAEAWDHVLDAVDYEYRFPGLLPIAKRALDICGGPQEFRYTEHMYALRREFMRVYADLRESALARGAEGRREALEQATPLALPSPHNIPELLQSVPAGDDDE